jgi:hypothetical protein
MNALTGFQMCTCLKDFELESIAIFSPFPVLHSIVGQEVLGQEFVDAMEIHHSL